MLPKEEKNAYFFSSKLGASWSEGLFVLSDSLKFLQLLSLNMHYTISDWEGFKKEINDDDFEIVIEILN